MKLVDSKKLKPGEGMKFLRPNKTEAGVYVSMDYVKVDTFEEDNKVKIEVTFDNPFIKDK